MRIRSITTWAVLLGVGLGGMTWCFVSAADQGTRADPYLDPVREEHIESMRVNQRALRGEVEVFYRPEQIREDRPALRSMRIGSTHVIGSQKFLGAIDPADEGRWHVNPDRVIAFRVKEE